MRVEVLRHESPLLPEPVNSYRVSAGGSTFYIDAGLSSLPEGSVVLLTHHHWDHVYGVALSSGLRICAPQDVIKAIDGGRVLARVESLMHAIGYKETPGPVSVYARLYDDVRGALDRHTLYGLEDCPVSGVEAVRCPGHSEDHVCYIIGDASFLGDNYVTYTTSTTLTSPLEYIRSALGILGYEWRTAYPGHGTPTSKEAYAEWLSRVVERKLSRIARIASLAGPEPIGLDKLLEMVYGMVGDEAILFLAARNLVGYLKALEDLGAVVVDRSRSPWTVSRA